MQAFVALILVTLAFAAPGAKKAAPKKRLNLTPPGQKAQATEDPGSATRLLYEDPRNQNSIAANTAKKGGPAPVRGTCTDNMGMIFREGDPGFEGCRRTFSVEQPRLPGDSKRSQSMGFTIGQ